MSTKNHWEQVYLSRPADKLGWYTPHLQTSLNWIKELDLAKDSPVIDVGGGVSSLADDLLDAGHRSITIIDISGNALSAVKNRLGNRAELITWIEGDITAVELPTNYFELWHDRAVFHFLTESRQQQNYRDNLLTALKPGGHVIIGVFAPEAPPQCSGLPVQRYTPEQLQSTLGSEFELKRSQKELHITPGGPSRCIIIAAFCEK